MSIESIKVPDLGGAESVEVIEICVAVGDDIAENDSIVVLESDKASMEVPSPAAGKVVAIKIADGTSVSEGDVIIELEVASDAPQPEAGLPSSQPAQAPVEAPATSTPAAAPVATETAATNGEPAVSQPSEQLIKVPDLGGPDAVDVIEICVAVGDELSEGDALVVLESDKASMEVPSPASGKVLAIKLAVGDKVGAGDDILLLESQTIAVAPAISSKPAATTPSPDLSSSSLSTPATTATMPPVSTSAAPVAPRASGERPSREGRVYAGPAVRKLARELGVSLEEVKGSGPKSRVTKDDLKGFVKNRMSSPPPAAAGAAIPAVPEVDFAKFGEVNIEPFNKVQQAVCENMHRSWLNVPHVTQFDDADISDLEDFRNSLKAEAERRGVKLTPLPFLLKACAAALKANPKFNASLHADGKSIVYKQYVHIGVAVDTPVGLMVPVVRDVDKKSIWDLAAEASELAQKAKERKLKPAEMQGGCFSISSLGNIGGQGFTPIVNTPEVGILAVSKLTVKPVWNGSEFVPRKMLPLSLSYDHRVINGADAGRFFTFLTEVLADIRRLVL